MIRKVEQYHGAALARLVRAGQLMSIRSRTAEDYRSVYCLDGRVALYMKYSTSRLSPWAFAFNMEHQEEVAELRDEFEDVFVTLICGTDGIACLSAAEYQRVLDDDPQDGEWIRISRRPRQKYAISGSDDEKILRVGDNEYPAKVCMALRHPRST